MEERQLTALFHFDRSGQLTGILPGCNTDEELKLLKTAVKKLFRPTLIAALGKSLPTRLIGKRPATHD
jgi:hypothetical protein